MPDSDAPDSDAPALDASQGQTYRALAEEASFDLVLDAGEDRLFLEGEEIAYRFEQVSDRYFLLSLEGRNVPVVLTEAGPGQVRVTYGGRTTAVEIKDETDLLLERFGMEAAGGGAEAEVRAPMPGLVVRVMVEAGQDVDEGDPLLVLEAMKMENELRAPAAGTVAALHAEEGASADKGEVLVEIE